MAQFDVLDMNGKKVSTVELSDAVFGITPNEKAVHIAVVNFLANQRQGTQSTKTSGFHPQPAVDSRRRCPGPQAPRLQLPHQQEGPPSGRAERPERQGPGR